MKVKPHLPNPLGPSKKTPPNFLLAEEEKVYGDRCASGFRKLKLLGKGGCAVVWLCEEILSGQLVAVKQVPKSHNFKQKAALEACKREIFFCNSLERAESKHLTRLLGQLSDRHDLWAVFELGGVSLSKALFELKGEFCRGERLYKINHLPLYEQFCNDPETWKHFLRDALEALETLNSYSVVHADIKPDNVLVDKENYQGLKLVDFGSAFSFMSSGNLSSATPEYLPPEALELLADSVPEQISALSSVSHPWSFDVWSLGMIILEVASGLPLWLSFKARVVRGGRQYKGKGLLAVSGRVPSLVLREQFNIVENLRTVLHNCVGLPLGDSGLDFLSKLLAWHPRDRISPTEALQHAYLR